MAGLIDRRLALAQRLAGKFAPKVAAFFGHGTVRPDFVEAGHVQKGAVAESFQGGGITFSKRYLRTTDRRDLRGAIIHELTHVQDTRGGANVENRADLARYALNPKENPDWSPNKEVLQMARDRGVDVPQPNGPRAGRGTGRFRNTIGNNASKKTAQLSPSSAAAYGGQAASSAYNLYAALAANRLAKKGYQADFAAARGDIHAAKISGIASVENSFLDRGMSGGSSDLLGRTAVATDAQAQLLAAKRERNMGIMSTKQADMDARNQYYMELYQQQLQKAAERAEAQTTAFGDDKVLRKNDGGVKSTGDPEQDKERAESVKERFPNENSKGLSKKGEITDPGKYFKYLTATGWTASAAHALIKRILMNQRGGSGGMV